MLAAVPFENVPVLSAWDETAMFRAVRLELPLESFRAHQRPGQVVKVKTSAGEAYLALASAPATDRHADLLIKRGGRVADLAVTAAEAGGALELSVPFGKGFPVEEARGKDVLLFAAGSGIAPVRALVEHLLSNRRDFGRITLFYGQRRGVDFAYRSEHLDWERGGVRVTLCPSREDDAWQGVRGRVQEVARSVAFDGIPPDGAVAFVCGMHALVNDVRSTLAGAGVPPSRVHVNF